VANPTGTKPSHNKVAAMFALYSNIGVPSRSNPEASPKRTLSVSDEPLCREGAELLASIQPRIQKRLADVQKIPIAVLLWGPAPNNPDPLTEIRLSLRKELRRQHHLAMLSEDLCDLDSSHSLRVQELIQAQEFDLVVSLPVTPGSIAELHDIAVDTRVRAKLLVFVCEDHLGGYSVQSLMAVSTVISMELHTYPRSDLNSITNITMNHVARMRELKYLTMGRY
jgi:hypothetical protein